MSKLNALIDKLIYIKDGLSSRAEKDIINEACSELELLDKLLVISDRLIRDDTECDKVFIHIGELRQTLRLSEKRRDKIGEINNKK